MNETVDGFRGGAGAKGAGGEPLCSVAAGRFEIRITPMVRN